jgi:hypothetical protein
MADKRISQLVERTDIANNDVVPIVASGASTTNKATISSIQTYMQENLDVGVTSVGITLGSSGTDVNVTGSPITTSGNITINIPTASATNRGLLSSADWSTFNGKQNSITLTTTGTSGPSTLIGSTLNIPNYTTDLSGYVTLGTAQTITAQKTFTTSGSSDTMIISHGSGSGFALDVIKAGNGEAIRVNKTSGTGNAMTIIGGNFEAPTIVKTGGTSTQFLKADGSVDSSTYLTTSGAASVYVPYTGATTSVDLGDNVLTSGGLNIDNLGGSGGALNLRQATSFSLWSGAPYTSIYATTGNNLIINFSNDNRRITLNGSIVSASTPRTFTFPDATGTLALTSDLGGYLPLAGGILTGGLFGTTAQFSGDIQSGTRLIASATSQSIILTPNSGGTTNRIEGVGTLPLALVSGASITLAAGGTTPQITLATNGAVTLTGALSGTSATMSGLVTGGTGLRATGGTDAGSQLSLFANGSGNTFIAGFDINFNTGSNNARTTCLTLSTTGAATFTQADAVPVTVVRTTANSNVGIRYQNNTTSWYAGQASDGTFAISYDAANLSAGQFKLTSTGAATFSSDVNAGTGFQGRYTRIFEASAQRGGLYPYNIISGAGTDYSIGLFSESSLWFAAGGGVTKHLTIASTGAATFSNNVTANGFLSSNDRLYMPGNRPISDWFSGSLTAGYSQTNGYGWVNGAGNLVLGTDGVEGMRITSSRRIGIGYTPTNTRLGVLSEVKESQTAVLGNANDQGRAQKFTFVRHLPVVSVGNVLIIPFISQGSLNSNSIVRVMGHSARFNTAQPLGFIVEFAVGHLTNLSSLSVYTSHGVSAVSANGMNVEISFGSTFQGAVSNGMYVTIEYMTNEVSYSIDLNNVRLN